MPRPARLEGRMQMTDTQRTEADLTREKIKKYLQDLAAALGSLPREQANDIVEELRSHIVEKSAGRRLRHNDAGIGRCGARRSGHA